MNGALSNALILRQPLILLQQAAHLALERGAGNVRAIGERIANHRLVHAADLNTDIGAANVESRHRLDGEGQEDTTLQFDLLIHECSPVCLLALSTASSFVVSKNRLKEIDKVVKVVLPFLFICFAHHKIDCRIENFD